MAWPDPGPGCRLGAHCQAPCMPVQDARPMRKMHDSDPGASAASASGGARRGPWPYRSHWHCPSRWCGRCHSVVSDVIGDCRPFSKGGVQVDQLGDYGTKPRGKPLPLWGTHSTPACQAGPRFQQIGDGDGGASPIPDKSGTGTGQRGPPPPGESGTKVPSPSPGESGSGTGTGTGVSAPCQPERVSSLSYLYQRSTTLLKTCIKKRLQLAQPVRLASEV